MMLCGLYTCVAEMLPPAIIANGATMKVTENKSTAVLSKSSMIDLRLWLDSNGHLLDWAVTLNSLEVYGPYSFISVQLTN